MCGCEESSMSDTAATWLGRQTIAETRGFTPDGQKSGEQPTNASSFVEALGDRAGSGDALQGAGQLTGRAASIARPPGSWMPPAGNPLRSTTNILDDAGTSAPRGPGLFGR